MLTVQRHPTTFDRRRRLLKDIEGSADKRSCVSVGRCPLTCHRQCLWVPAAWPGEKCVRYRHLRSRPAEGYSAWRCSVWRWGWPLVAGCAKPLGPDLIDELRDADLREKRPQVVKQAGDSAKDAARRFEAYPGDDQFRQQTAANAGKRKAGPRPSSAPATGYQLNFDNASLAEVTKVILGDTLKIAYYYDPRVQGQVTLATGRSVSRDELLSVLESALKINNAVLIATDGGYRISSGRRGRGGRVGSVDGRERGLRRERAAAAPSLGRGDDAADREFHGQGRARSRPRPRATCF